MIAVNLPTGRLKRCSLLQLSNILIGMKPAHHNYRGGYYSYTKR